MGKIKNDQQMTEAELKKAVRTARREALAAMKKADELARREAQEVRRKMEEEDRREERRAARESVRRAARQSRRRMERRVKYLFTPTFWFHLFVVSLSAVLFAVNTKTFIAAGGLFPGGVSGVTLLIIRSAKKFAGITIPYMPVNLILNSIPIYIGFRYLGRKFTAWACYNIVLVSVLTDLIPEYIITEDILLISIFGAVVSALASLLCLWVDTTAGGTDFISVYLSVHKGMDSWNIVFGCNLVILTVAGLLFGWDKALYSMIYQYVVTQMVNSLYQKYQQQTLLIMTDHPDEVSREIYRICGHGATILYGQGSYAHHERTMVYSVVSRNQSRMVMNAVRAIDDHAFINSIRTEKIRGHFLQQPLK